MKKRIMTAGMLAMILAMGMTACANADTKEKSTTKKEQVSESDEKKEQKMSDNEANVMNEKQKKIYEKIKKTYNAEEQQKIADELEKKKAADEIKQEMVGLAMDAAGKFVRVSMDDRTKNALIEETLAEIGENTWLS